MENDVKVLYEAVKDGRVKLEDLSDKGLNAIKTYVYTKDKNFSTEQPQASKMTQQAMMPPKKMDFNYADTSMPQGAIRGESEVDQLNRNKNYNYPSKQPKEALLQRENVRARYIGTPPIQAKVGKSFKSDSPNYGGIENYPKFYLPNDRGFFDGIKNDIKLAADKITDSSKAFRAGLGQVGGGILSGLSLGLSDSKLIPDSMRRTENVNQKILGKDNAATLKTTGEFIGSLTPIGASYKLAKKVMPLLPKMNKFATSAATGALAGLGYQTAVEGVDQAVGKEEKSLGDSALNIGLAAGIGAVADPLLLLAPEAIKALNRRAQQEVAEIATNLYRKMNILNQRDLSELAASKYNGEKGLAKKLTGASNMKRYQESILTDSEKQAIRRKNADIVLREIADQQTKYAQKHQALNDTFKDLPEWQKQRTMQLYNESIKKSSKMSDFSKENVDARYLVDLDNLMSDLNKYDQIFESFPMEYEMGMADYNNNIINRGQLMDDRQKSLNKLLGQQSKIDNYRIYKENALSEAFDQLPQAEKSRLLQEYIERSKDLPKIQDMTLENKQAQYRQEVTPLFEQELGRQDMAINRQSRQKDYEKMFDDIQRSERNVELSNTPDIRQFSAENIRSQKQQDLDNVFGDIASREAKRSEDQAMYEGLVNQRENELVNVRKQINELNDGINEIEGQIKLINSEKEKQILNMTNSYWNDLKLGGKKSVIYDSIMEEVQKSGFIKVPSKESFYYGEYKNLPSTVKRKYFRNLNSALQIDEMSDAMGITANELLSKLNQDNPGVSIDKFWSNDFFKKYGNKPTKANVEQFVREQISNGELPIDEMLGISESQDGLQTVLNYMKQDRDKLMRRTGQQSNQPGINFSDLPKPKEKSIQLPTPMKQESPAMQLPSKKKEVKKLADVRKENAENLEKLRQSEDYQMGIASNQKNNIKVPKANQDLERSLTAKRSIPNQISQSVDKLKRFTTDLINDFRIRPILEPTLREDFNVAEIKFTDTWNQAAKDVGNIMNHFRTKEEYDLFRRIVVLRDFKATTETRFTEDQIKKMQDEIADLTTELKDEMTLGKNNLKIARLEKQIYTLNSRMNPALPKGVTRESVLDWLSLYENIANKSVSVKTALESYEKLMKAVSEDLVSRGKISADSVRDSYYPHRVLEQAFRLDLGTKGQGVDKIKTPYRYYTKERLGSEKDIDTAFDRIVTEVLGKIYLDNAIDDFAGNIARKTDILNKVKTNSIRDVQDLARLNQADIANDKSGKSKAIFFSKYSKELDLLGVPKQNKDQFLTELWESEVKNAKNPFLNGKLLDKSKFEYEGERYNFWYFNDRVHLIPENVFKELENFKNPTRAYTAIRAMNKITQYLKSALLVASGPAYQTMNIAGNAMKLLSDPKAYRYFGTASRILLTKENVPEGMIKRTFNDVLTHVYGKRTVLDKKVEEFALDKGIIEPTRESGIYRFTPLWEKMLYNMNPFSRNNIIMRTNTNISQLGDEFFRLMKLSADMERVQNGKMPIHRGMIDTDGLTDTEQIVTKVAREFFVDPAKQSPFMQTAITQALFPFFNWFAVTTQHLGRFALNNKKTTAALVTIPAAFEIWNNTGLRAEIEKDLDPKKRAVPHIITGQYDEKGKPYIIYLSGEPISAALSLFGLNYVPQTISDVVTDRKSLQEGTVEQGERMLGTGKTLAENFLNPLLKVPLELYRNRSFFTDQTIVPEGEKGTSEGINKRIEYSLKNLVPPYRMIQTAENQVNREADPQNPIVRASTNWLNPTRTMIQTEDMEWQRRSREQERTEKMIKSVNQARVDFIKAIVSKDETKMKEVISRKLLTKQQVENIRRNPFNQLKEIREEISNSTNSSERKMLLDEINALSKRIEVQKIKQLPKAIRKEVMEGR